MPRGPKKHMKRCPPTHTAFLYLLHCHINAMLSVQFTDSDAAMVMVFQAQCPQSLDAGQAFGGVRTEAIPRASQTARMLAAYSAASQPPQVSSARWCS